jgi:SAM-dependent methyltransferase
MADQDYQGVDNLEVLADAVRYSDFLVDCVVRSGRGCRTALDFGAGTGSMSAMTRARGIQVECVEPDPRLRTMLDGQGFRVYADLSDVADQSQEYIYSLNVLEHIEDDEATLAALYSKLKPSGRFFLYVPALQALYSSMDKKIGHYRRYHRKPLLGIIQRAGFVIERAEYADSLGVFATLLYKAVGSRKGDVSRTPLRIYDRVVFPVSRVLDRMGCARWFGKNLWVVARRPESGGTSR